MKVKALACWALLRQLPPSPGCLHGPNKCLVCMAGDHGAPCWWESYTGSEGRWKAGLGLGWFRVSCCQCQVPGLCPPPQHTPALLVWECTSGFNNQPSGWVIFFFFQQTVLLCFCCCFCFFPASALKAHIRFCSSCTLALLLLPQHRKLRHVHSSLSLVLLVIFLDLLC